MTITRIIRSRDDAKALARLVEARGYPQAVTIAAGESRSSLQNRLAQRWFSDIVRQLGEQTHDEVRAFCKLHFGVPILRAENEAFKSSYDRIIRPLEYAEKLEAIRVFDLPVSRLMSVKQMTQFMDAMQRHWTAQGVRLTDPESLKYEDER